VFDKCIYVSEIVMGPGQKVLTRVMDQFFVAQVGLGWVSHLWYGFGFGKFPLKIPNFSIFSFWIKKISSGRVQKYLGQRRVSLLFTASQKYAWVGSGPISLETKSNLPIFEIFAPWFNILAYLKLSSGNHLI